jgi:uncharacterized membrane protein YfcA
VLIYNYCERGGNVEVLYLFLIGFLAASIGSLIGIGGGIIIIPFLLYFNQHTSLFSEVTPQFAVGTSTLTVVFTALSASLANYKHKTISYKMGAYLFVGAIPGAIIGAWTNGKLDFSGFSLYFGMFLITVSIILMFKDKLKPIKNPYRAITMQYVDKNENVHEYTFSPIIGIPLSFAVGFLSGIFGIGGGVLLVPAMMVFFRVPPSVAAATSMFVILLSSTVNTVQHTFYGNILWMYALALIPGAWIGGKVGPMIMQKINAKTFVLIFRVTLILVGLQLITEGL